MYNIEINLIKENSILPNIRPLPWDVVIEGKQYAVAAFEGFVHSIGGRWGANNLWAWPRDEFPSYKNLIEFDGEGGATWGFRCNPNRTLKYKGDRTFVEDTCVFSITRNGRVFYQFKGDLHDGVAQAKVYISKLRLHPVPFDRYNWEEYINNRKIWYRSEPGIIINYTPKLAYVTIKPDGLDKFSTPAEFVLDEDHGDYVYGATIVTDIFDPHISWFRD